MALAVLPDDLVVSASEDQFEKLVQSLRTDEGARKSPSAPKP